MSTDIIDLAATDKRVARQLAAGERDRIAAASASAAADAATERKLRLAEGKLALQAKRDEVAASRAARRTAQREEQRKARRAARAARQSQAVAAVGRWWAWARDNAASVYSSLIYGLAVGSAVYGQISAGRAHGWSLPASVITSVAIEGLALTMALTAQQQRLRGERALVARSLTWGCALAAAWMQYDGHADVDMVAAVRFAALSVAGIVVWEVRSGAKHRKQLRDQGMIPPAPTQFGWRRWVRYPATTWAAWSLDIRDGVADTAGDRIALAAAEQAAARAARQTQRDQRDAQQQAEQLRRLAGKAATRAARKGEPGPALAALVRLAHTGAAPTQPALTATPAPTLTTQPTTPTRAADPVRVEPVRVESGRVLVRLGRPVYRAEGGSTHPTPTHPTPARPAESTRVPQRAAAATQSTQSVAAAATREPADPATASTRAAGRAGVQWPQPRAPLATARPTKSIRAQITHTPNRAADDKALTAAYCELVAELGREPSGAELGERAGVGKSTANRWKQTNTTTPKEAPRADRR